MNLGIYVHIPFCIKKCDYCDFYSLTDLNLISGYLNALEKAIADFSNIYINRKVDSIYIGGGTPSVINAANLAKIIYVIKQKFNVLNDAEITVECNPESVGYEFFKEIRKSGVNRISLGLQSANDKTLCEIGRLATFEKASEAVYQAQKAGFENISLDIILFLPNESKEDIFYTLNKTVELNPKHISAYILKKEPNTALYSKKADYLNEDEQADIYLKTVEFLKQNGYDQYEISNFAKVGFESRHNLKYWQGEDYLGIGPFAHSFIENKRFYFKDMFSFIDKGIGSRVFENTTSPKERAFEKFMTGLRLKKGVELNDFKEFIDVKSVLKKALILEKNSLLKVENTVLMLNERGFLVSNSIINYLWD